MAALEDVKKSTNEDVKSTNIYISRHLQRIDDTDSNDRMQQQNWYSKDCKVPSLCNNPYLSDKADDPENIE